MRNQGYGQTNRTTPYNAGEYGASGSGGSSSSNVVVGVNGRS